MSLERLSSPRWTMPRGVERNGVYEELLGEAQRAYDALADDVMYWSRTSDAHYPDFSDEYEEELWTELGDTLFPVSATYGTSGASDRIEMMKAWWTDARWLYGPSISTDGLIPGKAFREERDFDLTSRFVVSGLLGDYLLMQGKKSLKRAAQRFEQSPLDTAILVGGAALAATNSKQSEVGATYFGAESDGYIAETWTGGTFHGDFRTTRSLRPRDIATTSLNTARHHVFMPLIERESSVGAYHGVEPAVVGGLLLHLVERTGMSPHLLHSALVREFSDAPMHFGGNFGDYGDDNGAREARLLHTYLKEGRALDEKEVGLCRSIVDPNSDLRFMMTSTAEGVRFVNKYENGEEHDSFLIPNDEIPQYVVTLIRGGGGRTSPHAMLRVVDALVQE